MPKLEIEFTDPGKELAGLGQSILSTAGGGTTIEGLARCVEIPIDNSEFLDVLAAIQRRVRDVAELANSICDDDFDQDLRGEVISATKGFTQLLHPKNAHAQWEQTRSKLLPAKNVTALKFFSQTARRYRPLRTIHEDERQEALEQIIITLNEVLKDDNLDAWMKDILVPGLNRIHLVLRYLKFFGHEVAIAELILAHHKAEIIWKAVEPKYREAPDGTPWKIVALLSILGNLFIFPDQALTAFDRYKAWPNEMLRVLTNSQPPSEQRLLPAPVAIIKANEDDIVGPSA